MDFTLKYLKVKRGGMVNKFKFRIASLMKHSWKASPSTFMLLVISCSLICLVQICEIIALRNFFEIITDFSQAKTEFNYLSIIPIAIVLISLPFIDILEYIGQGYFYRRGNGYLQSLFHLKVSKKKAIDFEEVSTFDTLKKATIGTGNAPTAGRTLIQFIFYFLPFFVFTSIYLFKIKPMLIFVIIFIFISVLISEIVKATEYYKFENKTANLKRQKEYFQNCILSKEYYKETRTLGVFSYFHKLFIEKTEDYGNEAMKTGYKILKSQFLLRLVNILGYLGVIGLLLYFLLDGSISVGIFATVYYSVEKINNVLKYMVENIGETIGDIATTSFLQDFLETKEEIKKTTNLDKKVDIHIKNISFAYPNTKDTVLSNINLDIKNGETIAIVGENGAGKSTLTKIITGLHKPVSGAVLYGNEDINQYSKEIVYNDVSAIFQNFIKYHMTLKETIELSDITSLKEIDDVMKKAGVQQIKQDTLLSRDFGGTDLSGGEWQRIAIARGLYRQHEIIVLDEPTSAIDPLEETKLFLLFEKLTKGKTAVLVTHRLGSAKIADRIIVLDNGKITECGTHDELIGLKGDYYKMYIEQSKWYVR